MTPTLSQGQAEPTAIPARVYWAPLAENFYSAEGAGMGLEFYVKWKPRRAEFPQGEAFGFGKGSAHNPFATLAASSADLKAASVPVAVLRQHWLRAMECDHVEKRDKPHCACSLTDLGWHPSIGGAVEAWLEHVHAAAQLAAVAAPPGMVWPEGWFPIEQFGYDTNMPRRVWNLAALNTSTGQMVVLGRCVYGKGPRSADPYCMDEPHLDAWRHFETYRRVRAHLKPTHYLPDLNPPPAPGWYSCTDCPTPEDCTKRGCRLARGHQAAVPAPDARVAGGEQSHLGNPASGDRTGFASPLSAPFALDQGARPVRPLRMLTQEEAKDCMEWTLLMSEVENVQRKFCEVNGIAPPVAQQEGSTQ